MVAKVMGDFGYTMMNILNYFAETAYAAVPEPVVTFVGKVNRIFINPLIILLFAAALGYFVYGVFEFIAGADQAEDRETGKSHMLWGIIGMFVMFSVFAILRLIENTLGVTSTTSGLQ